MRSDAFTHLRDEDLLRKLAMLLSQERMTSAEFLAVMSEVDSRRLYVPAGYPSMYAYCVEELHLSEDSASKRIQAARAARRFPALFSALAEGKLHLSAVRLLAPHLTEDNAGELIQLATHRTKFEIENTLASRFGSPDLPGLVQVFSGTASDLRQNAMEVSADIPNTNDVSEGNQSEATSEYAPGHTHEPQHERRYFLQFSISKDTQGLLQYAQALLSHAVPKGDMNQVLHRALKALIPQLERQKFGGKSGRPGARGRLGSSSQGSLHVPAKVRRAVWKRDKGQCTFVGVSGHRCNARNLLEFDHVEPVARGGVTTVENMRLRCRAHNQYEAERVFGAGLMKQKRDEARLAAQKRKMVDKAGPDPAASKAERDQAEDLIAGLRTLGCRGDQARRAVEVTAALHGVSLEARMHAALKFLGKQRIERHPRRKVSASAGFVKEPSRPTACGGVQEISIASP